MSAHNRIARAPGVISLGLAILFLGLSPVWAQKNREQPSSPYVGSDVCQPCHDEIFATLSGTAHQCLLDEAARKGCESCHGPGGAHVNGNGDASKVFRFADASSAVVRERCGQCHQNFMGQDAGHQKLSCLECHSVHHYQQKQFLLNLGKDKLCQRCHQH